MNRSNWIKRILDGSIETAAKARSIGGEDEERDVAYRREGADRRTGENVR